MIRATDRIAYPSRATANDAYQGVRRIYGADPPQSVGTFLLSLETYCNRADLDFAVLASHSANECNVWRDDRFRVRRDGFGIGKTGPGVEGAAFDTYDDAAFFAVFEYRIKLGQSPILNDWSRAAGIYREKVDRLSRLVSRADWPKVERIKDLNQRFGDDDCVWMCDPKGPEAIVNKGRAIFPDIKDQQEDQPDVTMPTIPVIWTPVPAGAPNNPSGMLLPGNLIVVWHENGNPNSDADDESRFLLNGGGSGRVSYHFAVDHERAYQMFALNELCYHAADGCDNPATDRGCFRGVAIEHCQDRDPGRWAATKRNGAILTAMIVTGHPSIHFGGRAGDFSADRIETHQAVSDTKKHCPDWMLDEGVVDDQIRLVKSLVAMNGGEEPEPPAIDFPAGMDLGLAKAWFGSVKAKDSTGKMRTYAFNPEGAVSALWLAYGAQTGRWPKLTKVEVYGGGRTYFRFADGFTVWKPNEAADVAVLKAA